MDLSHLNKKSITHFLCPHLSRSPEYFSIATSLGRAGREEGLAAADAAGEGLVAGGERRGL